jgi:ADP-heptose:LPS heptosyltransferase
MQALLAHKFDLVVNLRSDHGNVPFAASISHRALLSYTNDTSYAFLITHPLERTVPMHATEQHRFLLASIGAKEWSDPTLYPAAADRAFVESQHYFAPGTVALFPGAGVPLKKWPLAKFAALARRLLELGLPVVVVGARDEQEAAAHLATIEGVTNLCGKFSLMQLAAALGRCSALVSNDSAPVHIAAAMGTPVVVITRPLVRDEFAPVGPNHATCCATVCSTPCSGFDPVTRLHLVNRCACIEDIPVAEVVQKTLSVMSARLLPEESSLATTRT